MSWEQASCLVSQSGVLSVTVWRMTPRLPFKFTAPPTSGPLHCRRCTTDLWGSTGLSPASMLAVEINATHPVQSPILFCAHFPLQSEGSQDFRDIMPPRCDPGSRYPRLEQSDRLIIIHCVCIFKIKIYDKSTEIY